MKRQEEAEIFVRIDRESIRHNSQAGQRYVLVPGRGHIEVLHNGAIRQVKQIQRIDLIDPQPSHFYKYLPAPTQCNRCGAKIDVDELECSDDDENWVTAEEARICPKCGAWECCPPVRRETLKELEIE